MFCVSIFLFFYFLFCIYNDGCCTCLVAVAIKSPFQRRKPKNTILLKKQVKFTDDSNIHNSDLFGKEHENEEPKAFTSDALYQGWLTFDSVNKTLINNPSPKDA